MKNNPTHAVHQATRSNNWDPKSINQKLYNLDHQIHLQPTKSKSHQLAVELKNKKKKPFSFIGLGPYNYKLQNLTKRHRQRKANSLNRPQATNSIPKKMKPKQQLSSTNDKSNLIWSGNRVVVIIDVCGTGRLWSEGRLDSTNPWGFVELPGGYDGAKGAHVLDSLCSSKKRETKLIENLFFSFLKNKKVKILLLFY